MAKINAMYLSSDSVEPEYISIMAEPDELTRLDMPVERCEYCGNVWHENSRGGCVACGAPAPKDKRYRPPGVIELHSSFGSTG